MGFDFKTSLDLNQFWEKTPLVLKYILLITIIVGSSYFLFARKVDTNQIQELHKIQQGIEVTYQLVDKFESFQRFQTEYNNQIIKDIRNIYILVTELNDNINTKFDYLIKSSDQYNEDLIDKMILLNESFDRISKAYQLEKLEEKETPELKINVRPIKKNEIKGENEWNSNNEN
jgi:hypothetical protein